MYSSLGFLSLALAIDLIEQELIVLEHSVLLIFECRKMPEFDLPIRQKLTKKLLMGLPTSVFVVSNCHRPIGPDMVTPVFAEKVVPLDDREWQWQRIKECGANGRTCEVHKTSEEYKRNREFWTKMSSKWPRLVLFEVDDPRRQ